MKNRKYNKGDIVYSVSVNNHLIVNINKLIIDSYFYNEKTERYNYDCIGLGNEVIRDHEVFEKKPKKTTKRPTKRNPIYSYNSDKRERNPGPTKTSTASEPFIYTKDEIEGVIEIALKEKRGFLDGIKKEASLFLCPLTGGKVIYRGGDLSVLDGPTYYDVEGEDIVWTVNPRGPVGVYHTKYKGEEYLYKYSRGGNWLELVEITGANGYGMYVGKDLYNSEDEETHNKVNKFLEKEQQKYDEYQEIINNSEPSPFKLPISKKVAPKLVKNDIVEVKPMSLPTGELFYISEPEPEKIKIEIIGEGVHEIELSRFEEWELEPSGDAFKFGNTIIKIV